MIIPRFIAFWYGYCRNLGSIDTSSRWVLTAFYLITLVLSFVFQMWFSLKLSTYLENVRDLILMFLFQLFQITLDGYFLACVWSWAQEGEAAKRERTH